jgi:uncharacterized protein
MGPDTTLGQFVGALRNAEVAVSPAETLDAMAVVDFIGFTDRQLLRSGLSLVLAKTPEEKHAFEICFDRFFSFQQFDDSPAYMEQLRDSAELLGDASESDHETGKRQKRRSRRSGRAQQQSYLGNLLLSGDQNELALKLRNAAMAVRLERIRTLRERTVYTHRILVHMGKGQLDAEISELRQNRDENSHARAELLGDASTYLGEQVRDFVEEQYLLLVDSSGQRFIAEAVSQTKLTNMQVYYFAHIREAVRKLAHQLAKRHARKKKVVKRGQLDIRKTLRRNLAYDGSLFDIQWKQIRVERPRVFVICDVSGSVRNVSRFLLTFLYSLNELLPQVRSFAFSNELGEITGYFAHHTLEEAIEISIEDYGKGSTDYGRAFRDFKKLCLKDLDSRSTVIVLGDSRNNYFSAGQDSLKEISEKSRQLIWLNPEPRTQWQIGDAEMKNYLPLCHVAETCNSLKDLERIVEKVLRTSQ